MTDNETTIEPADTQQQDATVPVDAQQDTGEDTQQQDAVGKARDEAYKYRQRLRAAENERDQLQTQVAALTEERDQLAAYKRNRERHDSYALIKEQSWIKDNLDPAAVDYMLDMLPDEEIDAMLDPDEDGKPKYVNGPRCAPGIDNRKVKAWATQTAEKYPWIRRQRSYEELSALRTAQLAEFPQGSFRKPKGDPLRNALHR